MERMELGGVELRPSESDSDVGFFIYNWKGWLMLLVADW